MIGETQLRCWEGGKRLLGLAISGLKAARQAKHSGESGLQAVSRGIGKLISPSTSLQTNPGKSLHCAETSKLGQESRVTVK